MHRVFIKKKLLAVTSFLFLSTSGFSVVNPKNVEDSYTINYSNVSLLEYIRFVSKICDKNFIYNESELNFTISVMSKEPITQENVMGTLIQVLRTHGLLLIEQNNNFVIHRSPDVRQFATIIGDKDKLSPSNALVTRIFRVKNANVNSVADIIRPMISAQALLEISKETRQLIVTDITPNIEKINTLIENLDSPVSPLDIEGYQTKFNSPQVLIDITTKILAPLAQGSPYILVPQPTTNTIYIVSTPQLIEKTLSVLSNLDVKTTAKTKKELKSENVFIYKPIYLGATALEDALDNLKDNLIDQGYEERGLIDTIASMEWIKETNSFIFNGDMASLDKLKEILRTIDAIPPEQAPVAHSFFTYKPKNLTAQEIKESLDEISKNLELNKGFLNQEILSILSSAKVIESTKSILFTGDPKAFTQVRDLLATVDIPTGEAQKPTFMVYNIKDATPELLEQSLKETAKYLDASKIDDKQLINAINGMKYIEDTHSLIFSAPPSTLKRLQDLLPTFDQKSLTQLPGKTTFILYKIQNTSFPSLDSTLKEMATYLDTSNVQDAQLFKAIATMKYIKQTNSIAFTGSKDALDRLESLLASIDITGTTVAGATSEFLIYKPVYLPGEVLLNQIIAIGKTLEAGNLAYPSLLTSINQAKWVPATQSILFTGDTSTLKDMSNLLAKIDSPSSPEAQDQTKTYFIYTPRHFSQTALTDYLDQIENNLSQIKNQSVTDKNLIETLNSKKWVEESGSFMFYGSQASLNQLKDLLNTYDVEGQQKKPSYFIYKLQNVPGDIIDENLQNFVKNLKKDPIAEKKHEDLLNLINQVRWIQETNSLMLTGTSDAIKEASDLIAKYDLPGRQLSAKTEFLNYKPKYLPAAKIEASLEETAKNLIAAGLADKELLNSIQSMKHTTATNSIIFTGSADSLKKIQDLLADIDNQGAAPAPIQHIGQETFLLYKLKTASGLLVIKSLDGVTKDLSSLSKESEDDSDFLKSLQSVKYISETNSLLFTGTPSALARVNTLVEKFDVTELSQKDVSEKSTYFVYKPQFTPGDEIKNDLQNFGQQLKTSGISDPDLFSAIDHAEWMAKTHSLVFTGTPTAIGRIKELLPNFDVRSTGPAAEGTLEVTDNTSFLVYKLQFHKGEEIQLALRAVARDLINAKSKVNKELLDSISSTQLIPMTNSLLVSGSPDTLKRLRELIRNLDIPLKQVFIEMLVIETSFSNVLQFGLNWAGKALYKNRGVAAINNLDPNSIPTMFNNLNNISASTKPSGSSIPFTNGFDLGVIGDLIFHKGRSFISLGSLLSALEQDGDTTIVMTPKLITQDSKTSDIFIGQNIPFIGSFVQNQSQTTISTSNLEYRDIGIQMTLTPVLGNSDMITLTIELARTVAATNAAGEVVTQSLGGVTGITTSKTTMNTTVHIPNKNFLVLSGMVDVTKARTKAGLPCLGSLPLIGAAFSENNRTDSNRNIVIFIRPHIINSHQDMINITQSQEDFFRDNAGTLELESDFEEAMELIKSVDDD